MPNLSITAADVDIGRGQLVETISLPEGETLAKGEMVRLDTNGKATGSNGTSAAEALCIGIVIERRAGHVTVLRKGCVAVGNALSALAYGAKVYLSDTDKTLADAAGTVTLVCGTVVPVHNNTTQADKLLRVDL